MFAYDTMNVFSGGHATSLRGVASGTIGISPAMSSGNAVPRILIIETSGRTGHVAVAHGSELLNVRTLDETRRHARDLAPAVAELLKSLQWNPRDIDAVFVSLGPGSYTGLR